MVDGLILVAPAEVHPDFVYAGSVQDDEVVGKGTLRVEASVTRHVPELDAKAEVLQGSLLEEAVLPFSCGTR